MNHRDFHQSLKSVILKQVAHGTTKFVLAKLQWGKYDEAYSLHVSPNSYTLSGGYQITDFLSHMSFEKSRCSFIDSQKCFARWVEKDFDLDIFAKVFDSAFNTLVGAQNDLEKCGYFFEKPAGLSFFFDSEAYHEQDRYIEMDGDGHTAMKVQPLKQSEDDAFEFKFTFLESDHEKGWVIHYRPRHPPLSSELLSVFDFLGLKNFNQCPEFDFEPCYWHSIDNNSSTAHQWFDSHAQFFSLGIEKLLRANSEIEKAGFSFLPFQKPSVRLEVDIEKRTQRPTPSRTSDDTTFDVAVSFAGSERKYAEQLATILKKSGFSVFYDDFLPEYLWGKNLMDTFDEIYRKKSRYCVIFVSKNYMDSMWTNHERQSAQARALKEKGKEYILPIKVDDSELEGMAPTIGYVSLENGIERIGELLIKKLKH